MAWREAGKSGERWDVPYLPIDPKDVGREYESDVIRINSQSGKGGVAFILKQNFGMSLPDKMKEEVGYLIKGVSDRRHQELSPEALISHPGCAIMSRHSRSAACRSIGTFPHTGPGFPGPNTTAPFSQI